MKISVPKYEDPLFNQEVVRIINGLIDWMIEDYEERPQRVTFSGPLGKYLYDMCIRDDWDLGKIQKIHKDGPNKIFIEYIDNVTIKKEDKSPPRHESLDGKIIEGIPGPNTMAKLVASMTGGPTGKGSNISIEKTERPKLEVELEELS